jgi:nucleotide-binding universal stress UspA family protein
MFDTIVVPIDGSTFSLRALQPAAAIAAAAGAKILVATVVPDEGHLARGYETVQAATKQLPGMVTSAADVLIATDPYAALVDLASATANVLCFATHDRNRLASRLLRSVGSGLVERAPDSFIVVGPHSAPAASAGEIVVALDGIDDPEPLLSVAVMWASRLGAPLRIVTVFEPTPADLRNPDHFSRDHGPPIDPEVYLNGVRERVSQVRLVGVETTAVPDPVSVAGGLATEFAEHAPFLIVVGGGSRRLWPPSVVSSLLRGMGPPMLVVNHSSALITP